MDINTLMSQIKITNVKYVKTDTLLTVLTTNMSQRYITIGEIIKQHNNIENFLILNYETAYISKSAKS